MVHLLARDRYRTMIDAANQVFTFCFLAEAIFKNIGAFGA